MAFHLTLVWAFGFLGNAISFMVALAPTTTFYQIYKRKSSQGYQSIPYVIGLFSAMLWLYYAIFKNDAIFLVTINTFTFFMQCGYISVYLFFATKKDRILTIKLVLLFNVLSFGLICLVTLIWIKGELRVKLLGWICMIFSLCVFVAPLGIIAKVIKTKSVEFMPISLSFFLTWSAVMWFCYGFFSKDLFVAVPNVLGFVCSLVQMVLYGIYRKKNKKETVVIEEAPLKLQELPEIHIIDMEKLDLDLDAIVNITPIIVKA